MTLPPLANITDVRARLPATAPFDVQRATSLLTDASAVIRSFTKQAFSTGQITEKIRPIGSRIRLTKRPVQSVDALKMIMVNGMAPVAFFGWWWDGSDEVWLANGDQVINLPETVDHLMRYETPIIFVTYTVGYDDVPDDVIGVLCSMVIRSLTSPGTGSMISENVGPFGYRLSDAAVQGPLTMTQSEKDLLKQYRRRTTTIETRW